MAGTAEVFTTCRSIIGLLINRYVARLLFGLLSASVASFKRRFFGNARNLRTQPHFHFCKFTDSNLKYGARLAAFTLQRLAPRRRNMFRATIYETDVH